MRVLLFTLAAIALAAPSVPSADTPSENSTPVELTEKIHTLIEVMGGDSMFEEMIWSMVEPMELMVPEVPPEWWDMFITRVLETDFLEMLVPLYARHLTEAEIDALIEFYGSPIGQAILGKLPALMQDSMYLGQMWGAEVYQDLIDELESMGHEVPDELRS
jgi:hypothetical protein